ncbi:MAG TPA: hypothetical protein VL156_15905 [Terriglobales bacterium]|nr:hypothetical protein [Terriglobales bacterium]
MSSKHGLIRPAFEKLGITGVGWHTAGTLMAELGEDQLTIRRLLAARKSQRNQQVFASGFGNQA